MKTCRVGNTGRPLDSDECFGAGGVYTHDEKQNCKVQNVVPEDVGTTSYLPALPGCNPIQPAPGPATVQTNCPNVVTSLGAGGGDVGSSSGGKSSTATSKATTLATSTASKATSKSVTTTTSKTSAAVSPTGTSSSYKADDGSTWTFDGCYVDKLNPRTLPNVGWWGKPITNSECAKGCSKNGYSISGAENGGQCFCGNTLDSKKVDSSECNSPCQGDSSQKCGGPARLSVYKKGSSKSKKDRVHRHLERHLQAVS